MGVKEEVGVGDVGVMIVVGGVFAVLWWCEVKYSEVGWRGDVVKRKLGTVGEEGMAYCTEA